MKIEHLDIINYKSIKELHVDLNPRINVFIGANNVGKSNIMAAMEYLLGPTYPVPNRLDKSDFYNGKDDQPLKIAMRFDDRNILSFDSTWVDYRGKERHGLNLNGSYANGDARDKYVSASI